MAEVDAGVVIIILSIVGLAFSFLKREPPTSEAGRQTPP